MSSRIKSKQQLSSAIEHLRTWASTKGVAWVPGMLNATRGELPTVRFSDDVGSSHLLAGAEAFSRTLDALDVAMLVVSVITLDEDTQAAAVGLFERDAEFPDDPEDAEMETLVNGMLADAHAAREHIGEQGSIFISAITRNPTMSIEWSATADWYRAIEASERVYEEMDDVDIGPPPDDQDIWEEIEPEPEPPMPTRRRIAPRW